MARTYSNNPAGRPIDAVRLQIGDTNNSDMALSDEEVEYFLSTGGSSIRAAILAVNALIARYSPLVDTSVGQVSKSYSQRIDNYKELLKKLESELIGDVEVVFDSHISNDPLFTEGMMDINSCD